jgi:hypothetical protein
MKALAHNDIYSLPPQYYSHRCFVRYYLFYVHQQQPEELTHGLVAMITCDLGLMLEITGGVSATTLAFIFPAACYVKLVDKRLPWYGRTKLPAVICVGFGIMVMAISLLTALSKSWTKEGSVKICV